jgi:hypothetical protein
VGSDIFRKGQWRAHDVLVQQIDVVAFRVRRIIIKWQVAGEHCVLCAWISMGVAVKDVNHDLRE